MESVVPEVNNLLRNVQPGSSGAISGDSYSIVLNYLNITFPDFCGIPTDCSWIHSGFGDRGHVLRLQIHDFNKTGSFKLLFDFNQEIFTPSMRENGVEHFMNLVDALLENLDTRIDQISLLSSREYQTLMEDYNDTATAYPGDISILQMIQQHANKTPEAVALSGGTTEISYQLLDQISDQIARNLKQSGIKHEDVVAIYMDRSAELIAALIGIIKAGAAFVPIDSSFPEKRLVHVLEDSGASIVLTQNDLISQLPQGKTRIVPYEELDQDGTTQ